MRFLKSNVGMKALTLGSGSLGAFFLLACATFSGCNSPAQQAAGPETPEVVVCRPTVQKITDFEEFPGRIDAYRAVEVRARASGYLEKVCFQEGADVKEGDRLFEIDPRIYQADRDRAAANVALAKAHVVRLTADFNRAKDLLPSKAISQSDYDLVQGDLKEAEAAVKVAEATLRTSEQNLNFTIVTALNSGRISRQLIDPGNMVKADETPLTTIVAQDPVYAYFDINERTVLRIRRLIEAGKLKPDQENNVKVYLGLADEKKPSHEGMVNFAENRVDATTGTLRVRGVFPNTKRILSPGMFARIWLPIGDPHEAILISEVALGSDQGQKFVYVVDDQNKVSYRRVEIGSLHQGLRVIEKGLKVGEQVVLSGLQKIRAGDKVRTREAPADSSAAVVSSGPELR